jgi:hypothetical protein
MKNFARKKIARPKIRKSGAGGAAQVVESLPNKHEALAC